VRGFGFEPLAAVRAAEVVSDAVADGSFLRGRDGDGHAADRVDGLLHELRGRGDARVAPGDELGEDRDRDLLLRGRPEIEARRAADMRERLLINASGREAPPLTAAARFALATSPT
jgi:hypothetical protein